MTSLDLVIWKLTLSNKTCTKGWKGRRDQGKKRRGGSRPRAGAGAMLMNSDDDGHCCWQPNIIRLVHFIFFYKQPPRPLFKQQLTPILVIL